MPVSKRKLWPNETDELLLRAALLSGERAHDAWLAWRQRVDYEAIDFAQRRLLPLLHENLIRIGVSDPEIRTYGYDTRAFWLNNELLFSAALKAISGLEKDGISALVIKGMPLALNYYPRSALRPMSDIDILVSPENAAATIKHFLEDGWEIDSEFIASIEKLDELVAVRNGFNVRRHGEHEKLDLHWGLFKGCFPDPTPLWDASECFEFRGAQLRTLSGADLLLHACAQGAEWDVVRPIRWIPDAMIVLANGSIDWSHFVEQARRTGLEEPMLDSFDVLRELLGIEVPAHVISELESRPRDPMAWFDYRVSVSRPIPIIGRTLKRYVRYRRTARLHGLGFVGYLKQFWGIPSIFRAVAWGARLIWDDVWSGRSARPAKRQSEGHG